MTAIRTMDHDELQATSVEKGGEGSAFKCARGHLPLVAMDVRGRIVGVMAHVVVTQAFRNVFNEPIEATYVFPLPEGAAVTGFSLVLGDRRISGRILERGDGREAYDNAIDDGRAAAIIEMERSDVFTVRVGNIGSGTLARVELTLSWPITIAHGEATFRFPLVVAQRYVPGQPLGGAQAGSGVSVDTDAVPDASRISPPVLVAGHPNPVRLSLSVELDVATSDVRCSLHSVDENMSGASRVIRLQPGERLDRDFILRFPVTAQSLSAALRVAPDDDGKAGTFALTILPPAEGAAQQGPRDVVFLLDQSGSMQGWKWESAKRAVARLIDTLSDEDRFHLVLFSAALRRPAFMKGQGLVHASDANRFNAVSDLGGQQADGGTEMGDALVESGRLLRTGQEERSRMVVLITDGQVANGPQLLTSMASLLRGVRVFVVGIDTAVSAGFLSALAAQHGGWCEMVESEARLDAVMGRLRSSLRGPMKRDVWLNLDGAELERVRPSRSVDLMAGMPVTMVGRYRGAMPARGELFVGKQVEAVLSVEKAPRELLFPSWARQELAALEAAYAAAPSTETERAIVDTSLQASVLSRFTTYVAVDEQDAVVRPGTPVHRITQPVEDAQITRFRTQVTRAAPVAPGIAPQRSTATRTQAGVLKGKFRHMSPEQIRGLPVDGKTDVFTLGIAAAELLGGTPLFQADSDFSLLEMVRNVELPSSLVPAGHCDGAEALVRAFLERDPAGRPAMAEAVQQIDALLARVPAPPESLVDVVTRMFPESAEFRVQAAYDRAVVRAFGPFDILERTAVDGESAFYRARLTQNGITRRITLRYVLPFVCEDPEFRREVLAGITLVEHPNLNRLHLVARDAADCLLIAMDPLDGVDAETLRRAFSASKTLMHPHHALTILREAATGLAHLHALGAVHRAFCPANTLIRPDGSIVVLQHEVHAPPAMPLPMISVDAVFQYDLNVPARPRPTSAAPVVEAAPARPGVLDRVRKAFWK